jgi:hypothetical protein
MTTKTGLTWLAVGTMALHECRSPEDGSPTGIVTIEQLELQNRSSYLEVRAIVRNNKTHSVFVASDVQYVAYNDATRSLVVSFGERGFGKSSEVVRELHVPPSPRLSEVLPGESIALNESIPHTIQSIHFGPNGTNTQAQDVRDVQRVDCRVVVLDEAFREIRNEQPNQRQARFGSKSYTITKGHIRTLEDG